MENSLLCDEEFLSSPPRSPGAAPMMYQTHCYSSTPITCDGADDEDRGSYLRACVGKQHAFLPRRGYVEELRRCPELSSFRHRAVRWIMTARVRLDLAFGTAFSAVNYLDRFVSLYTNMKWEVWTMELLSVACLSIAAKFGEVCVPSLDGLPVEDLDHSFDTIAIQRMELAVLRALDWRINCVTAHSFVDPMTSILNLAHHQHLPPAVADRVVELLLGAALDMEFLEFKQSAIAVSALRCALEELAPPESHRYVGVLAHLQISQEHTEETEECHKRMEERVADPAHSLSMAAPGNPYAAPSPVTVITTERHEAVECIVDVGLFLEMGAYVFREELFCEPKKNHRKRKRDGGEHDAGQGVCPPSG